EFGGDRSAIGRVLRLDGHPYEIVGVTPPSFFGLEVGRNFDVALPLCAEAILRGQRSLRDQRDVWMLAVIGRLKPGWTSARASAHLATISKGVFEATLPARYS